MFHYYIKECPNCLLKWELAHIGPVTCPSLLKKRIWRTCHSGLHCTSTKLILLLSLMRTFAYQISTDKLPIITFKYVNSIVIGLCSPRCQNGVWHSLGILNAVHTPCVLWSKLGLDLCSWSVPCLRSVCFTPSLQSTLTFPSPGLTLFNV